MLQAGLFVCLAVIGSLPVYADDFQSPKASVMDSRTYLETPRGRNAPCHFSHGSYRHNTEFNLPGSKCVKYKCWHGKVHLREEGCELHGRCHRLSSTFESRCSTYTCTKSQQGDKTWYRSVLASTRCKDYYGRCHNQGSSFVYTLGGRLYRDCTCRVYHNHIRYNCKPQFGK